jgi:hypothetical protein
MGNPKGPPFLPLHLVGGVSVMVNETSPLTARYIVGFANGYRNQLF